MISPYQIVVDLRSACGKRQSTINPPSYLPLYPLSTPKSTMDREYHALAKEIQTRAATHPSERYIVAIAGIPGSGKTTTASEVIKLLNDSPKPCHSTHAALLSMDGFHLSRATLDQLPNREEAYIRRGAPWTFDAEAFLKFMQRLRSWADQPASSSSPSSSSSGPGASNPSTTSEDEVLYAPTFDHHTKDPVENGTCITSSTSIVIVEGNYLLLDEPVWRDVAGLVDYKVFVDADAGVARERLARRHVEAGIEGCLEDGFRRVDANDYLNGLVIRERLVRPDLVVRSVES